ncbi:hypothetical protein ACFYZE_19370 [Streptomyces sp. NPDC001796]|uniref:hypothetical protein n=1 Tax=Streptomyces sp. NPDC001796 TaxID=3364609 RepID=UPI0036C6F53D
MPRALLLTALIGGGTIGMVAYLHERYRTPALNILLTGAVGLIALRMGVATSTSFINFGAFTTFTFVSVSLLATYVRRRGAGDVVNPLSYVVAPAIVLPPRRRGAHPEPDLVGPRRGVPGLPDPDVPRPAAGDVVHGDRAGRRQRHRFPAEHAVTGFDQQYRLLPGLTPRIDENRW